MIEANRIPLQPRHRRGRGLAGSDISLAPCDWRPRQRLVVPTLIRGHNAVLLAAPKCAAEPEEVDKEGHAEMTAVSREPATLDTVRSIAFHARSTGTRMSYSAEAQEKREMAARARRLAGSLAAE